MDFIPMPHFFIVRIEIEKQKERKEKIGSLYLHHSEVKMERAMQNGEIVAIGSMAAKHFPDAIAGDILLIHHFVETQSLIASDGIFNYYNCTASEYNGRRNESYGLYRNGEIIPHPDFVFIETAKKKEIKAEEFEEEVTEQVGSLILFKNWEEKREDKEAKALRITNEIKHATKGKTMSDSTKMGIEEMQKEAETITQSLNRKEYKPYPLAFYNPSLQKSYNKNLKECSKVYCLNIATLTTIEIFEKEYLVVNVKYISMLA